MKKVLTIAGSDSGGGAGIQADLKTFAALNCHGASVVAAVTSQNTLGVRGVFEVPATVVESQIDAVLEDLGLDAVKVGMLFSEANVLAVAAKIRGLLESEWLPIVVDPVSTSSSGALLLEGQARDALVRDLLPLASVVTPNLHEASALTGLKVLDLESMRKAARALHDLCGGTVVITGGHLDGEPVDLFHDGSRFVEIAGERIEGSTTHGTGCVHSAAIAAGMARGLSALDAARGAREIVAEAIRFGAQVGEGPGPADPLRGLLMHREKSCVLGDLVVAMRFLADEGPADLIPEVQSNLAFALPDAGTLDEVAGYPGRIVCVDGRIQSVALPRFGASRHIARIVLTAMRTDPSRRCCFNVRYVDDVEERARKLNLSVASFRREDEPPSVRAIEGSSLEWGTASVLEGRGDVPDLIYDRGGDGKEPMIRVLGKGPLEVVATAIRLIG